MHEGNQWEEGEEGGEEEHHPGQRYLPGHVNGRRVWNPDDPANLQGVKNDLTVDLLKNFTNSQIRCL